MGREKIIADLEEYESWLRAELQTTTAALAGFRGKPADSTQSASATKRAQPKARGEGSPFKPKYPEPASVYIVRELEEVHPAGLALGETQERLQAKGREYTDEAVRLTLNKMTKAGRLRKQKAPPNSKFKVRYVLVKP